VLVHFKGGPLGGEVRQMPDDFRHRVVVPAFSWSGSFIASTYDHASLVPETLHTTETYELRPIYGSGYQNTPEFEGLWVNPNAGLIKQNQELKERVESLEHLQGVLDSLERYFRNPR
jgi:hypothetical protein